MKLLNRISLLLIFLSGLMFACQPSEKQLDISSSEQLEAMVDSIFNRDIGPDEPGAAVLVAYDGEMVIGKGYGLANKSGGVPVRPSTNFRMGSVSKQFTALCVLKLIDANMLSMDQDVNEILGIESLKGVKIKHLLHHTSGIPEYIRAFNRWNKAEVPQNEDVLAWYAENGEPEFEPGSQFRYSNGGYNLLATIVERVSRVKFEQFANQQVFFSNGMLTSLYYNLGYPVAIPNRAYCYAKQDGNWNQVDGNFLNGLIGEGGVYTSIRDYFQFDRQLRMGHVLKGEAINLVFTPGEAETKDYSDQLKFLKPGNAGYAAGWFVRGDKAFHAGSWKGVRTIVVHDLSRPLTLAIFRNSEEPIDELINELYILADSYAKYVEKHGAYGN